MERRMARALRGSPFLKEFMHLLALPDIIDEKKLKMIIRVHLPYSITIICENVNHLIHGRVNEEKLMKKFIIRHPQVALQIFSKMILGIVHVLRYRTEELWGKTLEMNERKFLQEHELRPIMSPPQPVLSPHSCLPPLSRASSGSSLSSTSPQSRRGSRAPSSFTTPKKQSDPFFPSPKYKRQKYQWGHGDSDIEEYDYQELDRIFAEALKSRDPTAFLMTDDDSSSICSIDRLLQRNFYNLLKNDSFGDEEELAPVAVTAHFQLDTRDSDAQPILITEQSIIPDDTLIKPADIEFETYTKREQRPSVIRIGQHKELPSVPSVSTDQHHLLEKDHLQHSEFGSKIADWIRLPQSSPSFLDQQRTVKDITNLNQTMRGSLFEQLSPIRNVNADGGHIETSERNLDHISRLEDDQIPDIRRGELNLMEDQTVREVDSEKATRALPDIGTLLKNYLQTIRQTSLDASTETVQPTTNVQTPRSPKKKRTQGKRTRYIMISGKTTLDNKKNRMTWKRNDFQADESIWKPMMSDTQAESDDFTYFDDIDEKWCGEDGHVDLSLVWGPKKKVTETHKRPNNGSRPLNKSQERFGKYFTSTIVEDMPSETRSNVVHEETESVSRTIADPLSVIIHGPHPEQDAAAIEELRRQTQALEGVSKDTLEELIQTLQVNCDPDCPLCVDGSRPTTVEWPTELAQDPIILEKDIPVLKFPKNYYYQRPPLVSESVWQTYPDWFVRRPAQEEDFEDGDEIWFPVTDEIIDRVDNQMKGWIEQNLEQIALYQQRPLSSLIADLETRNVLSTPMNIDNLPLDPTRKSVMGSGTDNSSAIRPAEGGAIATSTPFSAVGSDGQFISLMQAMNTLSQGQSRELTARGLTPFRASPHLDDQRLLTYLSSLKFSTVSGEPLQLRISDNFLQTGLNTRFTFGPVSPRHSEVADALPHAPLPVPTDEGSPKTFVATADIHAPPAEIPAVETKMDDAVLQEVPQIAPADLDQILPAEQTAPEDPNVQPVTAEQPLPVDRPKRKRKPTRQYEEGDSPERPKRRRRRKPAKSKQPPPEEVIMEPPPEEVQPFPLEALDPIDLVQPQPGQLGELDDSIFCKPRDVKKHLKENMKGNSNVLRFSDCCEVGVCSRRKAASFFSSLLDLEKNGFVELTQPNLAGDPRELYIKGLDTLLLDDSI